MMEISDQWQNGANCIICGDVLAQLRKVPDKSIHCCVTSPPYWGLRDYGTAKWGGGDPECDHKPPDEAGLTEKPTAGQRTHAGRFSGPLCWKCGATRIDSQLGLEKTPELYVESMVAVFREVRRVLRDDGTLWLNLGDSYAAQSKGSGGTKKGTIADGGGQSTNAGSFYSARFDLKAALLKPKDLVGIPWRVAFALQSDGWYLRQDLIWAKPNPMPESVRDRCTKAHEYIFLLAKSERYYYDHEAIKEPAAYANSRESAKKGSFNAKGEPLPGQLPFRAITDTRNKRSVWWITPKPFKGAHFATFPPDLIEPCILAGCPEGGVVLDPFFGAGTAGLVAVRQNKKFVGIDLNPDYCEMAKKRIENDRR